MLYGQYVTQINVTGCGKKTKNKKKIKSTCTCVRFTNIKNQSIINTEEVKLYIYLYIETIYMLTADNDSLYLSGKKYFIGF